MSFIQSPRRTGFHVSPGALAEGPGYTWACENALVEEVAERIVREKGHRRRLDYILVGAPLLYRGYARVETCRVVLDRPRDGVWASAHFGVFAEIALYPV